MGLVMLPAQLTGVAVLRPLEGLGEVIVLASRGMAPAVVAERARPLLDQVERAQLAAALDLEHADGAA